MKTAPPIPVHTFQEDDSLLFPVRFVSLLASGSASAAGKYDFSMPHRHNYYELFFFVTGGGDHHIDFEQYPVLGNSVHIVSPGQVHLLNRAQDSFGCVIHFSANLFTETKNKLLNSPFLHNNPFPVNELPNELYEEFQTLFSQLEKECLRPSKQLEIIKGYVHLLLLKYVLFMEEKYADVKSITSSIFNNFRLLVEQEYKSNKLPSFYTKQLMLSEKSLNDLCKRMTGNPASDYIRHRVILEAKRLLGNSDLTMKEIAYDLGFEDPSYFNRFFRKNTGLTPGDWRKHKDE